MLLTSITCRSAARILHVIYVLKKSYPVRDDSFANDNYHKATLPANRSFSIFYKTEICKKNKESCFIDKLVTGYFCLPLCSSSCSPRVPSIPPLQNSSLEFYPSSIPPPFFPLSRNLCLTHSEEIPGRLVISEASSSSSPIR